MENVDTINVIFNDEITLKLKKLGIEHSKSKISLDTFFGIIAEISPVTLSYDAINKCYIIQEGKLIYV